MSKIFELEIRRKIYDLISDNPGLHARKIAEILNISPQLVDYHILYLVRQNLITVEQAEGYKRCFVEGAIGAVDKKILSLMRREIPLKIILFLLKNPHSRHGEICKELDIKANHLSYHLNKLIKINVVIMSVSGDKTGYSIRDEKEIVQILIKYRPVSVSEIIDETWAGFDIES